MNAKNLSLSFLLYGGLLFGAAAFCFWAQSLQSTAWFFLAGIGVFSWAHFLNRKHYWGLQALLVQLFVTTPLIGWQILQYFRNKTVGSEAGKLTEHGFVFYSLIFGVSLFYLLLASRSASRIRHELS